MAMFFANFIIAVILVAAVYARNKSPLLDDDNTRVVNKAAGRFTFTQYTYVLWLVMQPKIFKKIIMFSTRIDNLSLSATLELEII